MQEAWWHSRARPTTCARIPAKAAAVAAVELCSLAFHVGGGEGNLTSSLIFGDGAGAVLLQPGAGDGLEILDSMSVLVPGTRDALGFDLTDRGFYPVLTRELTTLLPAPTAAAASPAAFAERVRARGRDRLAPPSRRCAHSERIGAVHGAHAGIDALVVGIDAGVREHLVGGDIRRDSALPGRGAARPRRDRGVRAGRVDRTAAGAGGVLIRGLVCGAMGAARLAELGLSRRNMRVSGRSTEGPLSRRTYPLIVAVHTVAIVGTFLAGRRRPSWPWLALLLAVQPLRAWVLATLGHRWNARAAVPAEMEVASTGPYAYVRHPNYAVVVVELAALPMAFGLRRLALFVSATNALLLAARLREEEAALDELPGYRAHFAGRKRFVPGVF